MEGSGPVPLQEIKDPGGPKFTDLSDPDLVHCFFLSGLFYVTVNN
jgi:hypothetical protein